MTTNPQLKSEGLTQQEASRQTKRTEGRSEQHGGDATIGNPWNTWAEERPAGKAISTSCRRDRDNAA